MAGTEPIDVFADVDPFRRITWADRLAAAGLPPETPNPNIKATSPNGSRIRRDRVDDTTIQVLKEFDPKELADPARAASVVRRARTMVHLKKSWTIK